MEGWIRLHRQLLDSEVFANEKALKIWVWLIIKARFDNGFVPVIIGKGSMVIELKRGQLLFGRFTAEDALNIDGSTIYKWIQKFKDWGMINIESNSHSTVITICNYDYYNQPILAEITATQQQLDNQVTATRQPNNTNNKDKNDNKEKKEKNIIPEFTEFKNYALLHEKDLDIKSLEHKYNAWRENNWKDGKNQSIKNWKSKLLQTIPYLKKSENLRNKMPL